jgi:hypothetical protein
MHRLRADSSRQSQNRQGAGDRQKIARYKLRLLGDIHRNPSRLIAREQLGCRASAEKGTRSNECYTKELEALPSRRKQQPLLPRRRLRLSGDRLRQSEGVRFDRSSWGVSISSTASASRFTAGAFGFLTLRQCGERPDRHSEPSGFDMIPSQSQFASVRVGQCPSVC